MLEEEWSARKRIVSLLFSFGFMQNSDDRCVVVSSSDSSSSRFLLSLSVSIIITSQLLFSVSVLMFFSVISFPQPIQNTLKHHTIPVNQHQSILLFFFNLPMR
eukprot:TRINITY_DN67359_c3_g2_i3.p3 TRINITY_DN67359_c3_g2~~TRINITY_DN67359_c3_g2_i3.p3  ORF type:complete len:103 (-),score=16.35 TRINITY_DN67359_c3_g2_i3:110-418(-)